MIKAKSECRRKGIQEKESMLVVQCRLKILSLGIIEPAHEIKVLTT